MNIKRNRLIQLFLFLSIVLLLVTVSYILTINDESNNKILLYNIFFVETNSTATSFNLRQMCSIESAAKNNPNAQINVLSINAKIQIDDLFETYKNIKYIKLFPKDIFQDTPLYDWWISNKLTKYSEYYTYAHLADALRLAVVCKYGGFYLDLDMITLRSVKPLSYKLQFVASTENDYSKVGSGFIHSPKSHPFIHHLMSEFAKNYDPNGWAVCKYVHIKYFYFI